MDERILSENSHRVISRDEAKELGLKRYFTGEPCKKMGHVCERIVVGNACVGCKNHGYLRRKTDPSWEKCSLPECENNKYALGFCRMHHKAFKKHGDPFVKLIASPGEARKWILENIGYSGEECLIWPFGRTDYGYGQTNWDGKHVLAHIVICTLAHGEKPSPGLWVAHSCGNGAGGCVAKNHLRWATPKENSEDKLKHGTTPFGQSSGTAKLTEADIPVIRSLAGKVSQRKLAKMYGVSRTAIVKVIKRENWWHIE